jgi:hypothetical protein
LLTAHEPGRGFTYTEGDDDRANHSRPARRLPRS